MAEDFDLKEFYEKAVGWLLNSPIRDSNGGIYSWINPEKPGYVYPEIMGYYIRLLSSLHQKTGNKIFLERAIQTAENLMTLISRSGSVSRGDIDYVFDSGICLSGLISLSQEAKTERYNNAIKIISEFVHSSLEQRCVSFQNGKPFQDDDSWSLSFGSSSLKTCIALHDASEFLSEDKYSVLAESMRKELVDKCFRGGHFIINPMREWVYTHPHCYATEGLMFLQTKGQDFSEMIMNSAEWLARMQNSDGSLYNWYCNPGKPQEKQGDATSQAIRIWISADKRQFSDNIRNGFKFLMGLQSEDGGLAYSKGSQDINSWVTMFAAQAALWYTDKPEERWVV